jgi:hypothetical protein
LRSKSIALVFERSGGVAVGEGVGKVADLGDPEIWGAELGRRGDGSILFEDLGLGGEAGVGIGECESEGDIGEKRASVAKLDASRVTYALEL